MTFMICRNRVKDYETWKSVFDSHKDLHIKAGMQLTNIWREINDPNNIFFNFIVEDIEKAEACITTPEAEQAGRAAGVIDGEYYYANSVI